jgi:hypothetical protein
MKIESTHSVEIPGRGKVFCVYNPHDCCDFEHFIGHNHWIDGKLWHVVGVELAAELMGISGPRVYKKGAALGLIVQELP